MKKIFFLVSYYLILNTFHLNAQVQWASKLVDFSSEYKDDLIRENSTRWSASQVLGYPNTMKYGQSQLAWTPSKPNNGKEFVTVSFATAQTVQQIIIGENNNAGAIAQIILYDNKGKKYEVYEKTSFSATPKFDYDILTYIKIKPTYNVVKLKLILNTSAVGGGQEIDCIGISSTAAPYKQTINVIKYSETVGLPENLGPNVNSSYYDHLPIISPDGSMLYFTRKLSDEKNKGFDDDIYVSTVMPTGKFSKAEDIGPPLNTTDNNFVCYVSSDNNRLYVANKYIKNTYNYAGLSVSTKQKNGDWSKPKPLNIPDLYNKNEFAHYHMSIDEDVVLMAIQRDDTYGDLDLYVSQKYKDGDWSKPKNLGPVINTVGAEGSVFLAADGKTIYFSSTGHPGFGNYDMYMSKRLDDTWTNWSKPLNLGDKINTDEMDIYYTIPAAGDYAYFSSGKTYFGLNDLYRIKLPKEIRPEFVDVKKVLAKTNTKTEVKATAVLNVPSTPTKQETKPITPTPTSRTTTPTIVATSPTKPVVTPTQPIATTNPQVDDFQKKLDELKRQQNNVSTPTSNTLPAPVVVTQTPSRIETPKIDNKPAIVYTTKQASPNLKTEDEILAERKALNDLKQQQAVVPKITEEDLLKKAELENQVAKPLTREQLAAQQQIKNNPTINPNNDNLNSLSKKQMPVAAPVIATVPTQNQVINQNYITNEVDPNTLQKKPEPVYNQPLKTSAPQTDDLQQKLDELKKQQASNKIATASSTLNTNKKYNPNENTNYYPNPAPVIATSNAKSDALEQKLEALKDQQRQVGQSNTIAGNPWQAKPYEAQPIKERQEDVATQEYDDYQKKLEALKTQQKNVPAQIKANTPEPTYNNSAPTIVDNQEPIKDNKSTKKPSSRNNSTSQTIADLQTNNAPIVEKTDAIVTPNPVIQKYEEKLRKIKEEMAALGTTQAQPDTKIIPKNDVVAPEVRKPETIVVEEKNELPITIIEAPSEIDTLRKPLEPTVNADVAIVNNDSPINNSVDLEIENVRLDSIKNAQTLAAANLDKLGNSKQDLEKDISDLQDQRTKFASEKDRLASQNTQLASEKDKLEAEKIKMDELIAQMQLERDRLAAEKLKMEQDKAKLEALKKQQEREVLKLNRSIDSLSKIKQTASNNIELQQKYDLFNVPIEVGAVAIADKIFFVADAAFLQIPSYPELDKVVAFLKKNKTLKIEIGGHTNGLCDDAFCNKLSNDRAKTCVDYLVSNGIDRNRLSYKGYGKQHLIASPGSPLNQRVEIKILSVK